MLRVPHGGEPVRDDERRPAEANAAHVFLDQALRLRIEARGGIVQYQDARIEQEGAGDGQALLLPAAERHATFPDDGLVAVGQLRDEVVRVRRPAPPR